MRSQGFSMLEVLLVLALLGLAAGLLLPPLHASIQRWEEDGAIFQIAAQMEALATLSILEGEEKSLTLEDTPQGLRIQAPKKTWLAPGLRLEAGAPQARFTPQGLALGGPWAIRTQQGRLLHLSLDPLGGGVRVYE